MHKHMYVHTGVCICPAFLLEVEVKPCNCTIRDVFKTGVKQPTQTSLQMHQDKGWQWGRGRRGLRLVDILTWSPESMHFLGPKWDLL